MSSNADVEDNKPQSNAWPRPGAKPGLASCAVTVESDSPRPSQQDGAVPSSRRANFEDETDSSSSGSESYTSSDDDGSSSARVMALPRGPRKKAKKRFKSSAGRKDDEDGDEEDGKDPKALWSGVKHVVESGAGIYGQLPGGATWRRIVDERLMSASKLRQRLLDMWTLLGVITALVASFAVDGITNSASSFASFEEARNGSQGLCVLNSCITVKSLYDAYGMLISIGCLLSVSALAMSVLFYSYLLIHPVSKTRWFVRKNLHLFPTTFLMVMIAMVMVIAAICVQCVAAFRPGIGYSVVGLAVIIFIFFIWFVWRLESQTKTGLISYGERRRQSRLLQAPADKLATSVTEVVDKLGKTATKGTAAAEDKSDGRNQPKGSETSL